MSDPIDALIGDHLDGALDASGRRALEDWLAADPAHRRRFVRLVMLHRALSARAAAPAARRAPRRRPLLPYAAALAAALILVLSAWWLRTGSAAPAAAGPLYVPLAGEPRRLSPGDAVAAGSLRWDDGTLVELADGTRAVLGEAVGLHLEVGSLAAAVAPQPAARPARFTTAEAEVGVIGTTLTVDAAAGESAVAVSHGRVRVRRVTDGAEAEVGAGACLAVAPQGELRVRPVGTPSGRVYAIRPGDPLPPDAALGPGDVIEFAPGVHRGAWRLAASGTRLRPLLVRGAGMDASVLDAGASDVSGAGAAPRAALQLEGSWIAVSGLGITGARNRTNAAGIRLLARADGIAVRDCRIHGNDQGIVADAGSGSLLVDGCAIAGNGSAEAPGLTHNLNLGGRSAEVRGSLIDDAVAGVNVKLRAGTHRLIGCRIAGGGDGEIVVDADASCSLEIIGCVVAGRARPEGWNRTRFIAVNAPPGLAAVRIIGSTLVAGEPRQRIVDAGGGTIELSGCIVAGSDLLAPPGARLFGRSNCLTLAAPADGLAGVLRGDPAFRDPAAGDWRLRPDSRCRTARDPAVATPPLEPPGAHGPARPRSADAALGAHP